MSSTWRLLREDTGEVFVENLTIASSYWQRLIGLQFRRALPRGSGLLLVPCTSIHTCFVRFPIDIVFLGVGGEVLGYRGDVRPWRAAVAPRGTHAVLELPVGGVTLPLPARLCLETSADEGALPRTLRAWRGQEARS